MLARPLQWFAILRAGTTVNLPNNGTLQCGSEIITYSSYTYDSVLKRVTFVPVSRNAKGSTIAAHSVADAVYWIENEIWVLYGNPTATAPIINSDKQPIIDLVNSTNSSLVYADFWDQSSSKVVRPLSAIEATVKGITQQHYIGFEDGTTVRPAAVIGLKNTPSNVDSISNYNFNVISWGFYHAGGFSNIVAAGEKRYDSSSPTWATRVLITDAPDLPGRLSMTSSRLR